MNHAGRFPILPAHCLLAAFVVSAVLGAAAQSQPKARQTALPQRELPMIPMPGRMTPSPFITRSNTIATPFSPSLPTVQQPRGTLPSPPRASLEAALARPFIMDVATALLLADTRAFTARAEIDIVLGPANARNTNTVPLIVAFLDGRMRMDMDVNEVRSQSLPAPSFTSLIELGLNQVVTVLRPDRRVLHLMYPDLKGFTDFPLTTEEAAGTMKVERADAGRGTALGQPCAMQKVIVTCEATNRHEATVWRSETQRGFPVQIQWHEPQAQVTFRYLEVNFIRPNLAVFEPPLAYVKYPDQAMLMQTASQRKNALVRQRRGP